MDDSNPLVELLHLKNYFTPKGLFHSFILLLFIIPIFLYLIRLGTDFSFSINTSLLSILVIEIINFFFWAGGKVYKNYIPVKKNKINIAFCLKVEKESEKIYQALLKTIKRKLQSADIYNNFAIIELHGETSFENRIEAEKFVSDQDFNLMIWGDTDEGTINQKQVTIFQLNFSYNFGLPIYGIGDFNNQKNVFIQSVNKAVLDRSWVVAHPDSLPTISVVSENLTEVTLYIIIRCIISLGYILVGYNYSEQLIAMLNNYPDKSKFPNFNEFKEMVLDIRQQLLVLLTIHYNINSPDITLAEKYARKALEYHPTSFSSLIHLAHISWRKGDKQAAYDFTKRAKRIEPSNDLVHFNEAFFALDQGDYEKAKNMYKKITVVPDETNIIDIISFIENEYDNHHKLAFLFAAGYLNYKFADRQRGNEMLKLFKKKTAQKQEYIVLLTLIVQ